MEAEEGVLRERERASPWKSRYDGLSSVGEREASGVGWRERHARTRPDETPTSFFMCSPKLDKLKIMTDRQGRD